MRSPIGRVGFPGRVWVGQGNAAYPIVLKTADIEVTLVLAD